MSASPAAASRVGSQSCPLTILLDTDPGLTLPGQRIMAGTRNAPSHAVFFSLRNGVIALSGQVFMWRPLSGKNVRSKSGGSIRMELTRGSDRVWGEREHGRLLGGAA